VEGGASTFGGVKTDLALEGFSEFWLNKWGGPNSIQGSIELSVLGVPKIRCGVQSPNCDLVFGGGTMTCKDLILFTDLDRKNIKMAHFNMQKIRYMI